MTHFLAIPWLRPLIKPALTLLGAFIVIKILSGVIIRWDTTDNQSNPHIRARHQTLARLLISVLRYTVDFIAIIIILDLFRIPTTSLIASAGILGLAISFGAQGLVQDIVTGFFILYEDQFSVGDSVAFPALSLSGMVLDVSLRVTKLQGPFGVIDIIPNRLILEVQNYTRGQNDVTVAIPVSDSLDPANVRKTLDEVVTGMNSQVKSINLSMGTITPGVVNWTITAKPHGTENNTIDQDIKRKVIAALYKLKSSQAQ